MLKRFDIKKTLFFRDTLGRRGEKAAWDFLTGRGYKILEKNFTCPVGEIDIVAEEGGRLRFVEVKTRRHHGFGSPEESVDARKRGKLVKVALFYLKKTKQEDASAVFDVLSVTWGRDEKPVFRLIQNAFDAA